MKMENARLWIDDFYFIYILNEIPDRFGETDMPSTGIGRKDKDFFHG